MITERILTQSASHEQCFERRAELTLNAITTVSLHFRPACYG